MSSIFSLFGAGGSSASQGSKATSEPETLDTSFESVLQTAQEAGVEGAGGEEDLPDGGLRGLDKSAESETTNGFSSSVRTLSEKEKTTRFTPAPEQPPHKISPHGSDEGQELGISGGNSTETRIEVPLAFQSKPFVDQEIDPLRPPLKSEGEDQESATLLVKPSDSENARHISPTNGASRDNASADVTDIRKEPVDRWSRDDKLVRISREEGAPDDQLGLSDTSIVESPLPSGNDGREQGERDFSSHRNEKSEQKASQGFFGAKFERISAESTKDFDPQLGPSNDQDQETSGPVKFDPLPETEPGQRISINRDSDKWISTLTVNLNESAGATSKPAETHDQEPSILNAPEGSSLKGTDPKATSRESDNPETRISVGQASGSQHSILNAAPEGTSRNETDPKPTSRESDNPETRISVGQASGSQHSILSAAPEGTSRNGTDQKPTSRESDNPETRIPVGQASGSQHSILSAAPEGSSRNETDQKSTSRESDRPETRTPVGQASGSQHSILNAAPEGASRNGTDPKPTSRGNDNPETRIPVGQASGNQHSILNAAPEGASRNGTDPKPTSRGNDNPETRIPVGQASGNQHSILKTISEGASNQTSSLIEKTDQGSSGAWTSKQDGTGEATPLGRPSGNEYPHPETEGDSKTGDLKTSPTVRDSGKNPDVNLNSAGRTPAAKAEAPTRGSGVASGRSRQGGTIADPTSEKTLSVGTIRRDDGVQASPAPLRTELEGAQSPTQGGKALGESTRDPVLGTAGVESQFGRSSENRIQTPLPPLPKDSGNPEISASSVNPDQPNPKTTQGTGGQPGPIEEGLETSGSLPALRVDRETKATVNPSDNRSGEARFGAESPLTGSLLKESRGERTSESEKSVGPETFISGSYGRNSRPPGEIAAPKETLEVTSQEAPSDEAEEALGRSHGRLSGTKSDPVVQNSTPSPPQPTTGPLQQNSAPTAGITPSGNGSQPLPVAGEASAESTPANLNGLPSPEEVVNQVVRGARILLKNDVTEVRIRLEPPELGTVRIRLVAGEKTLSGEIAVSNQEVKGIVESQLQQLRSSLTDQGLEVGRIDVSVRDDSRGGHLQDRAGSSKDPNEDSGGRRSSSRNGNPEWEAPDEDRRPHNNQYIIDYLA